MTTTIPFTDQTAQTTTGVILKSDQSSYTYQVQLDRGLIINEVRELDTGVKRNIQLHSRVMLIRSVTTNWVIFGVLPLTTFADQSDTQNAKFKKDYPGPKKNSYRPVNDNDNSDAYEFGIEDRVYEARLNSSFARLVLKSAGAAALEVGRACFRYMSSLSNTIKDLCDRYVLQTPGIVIAAITTVASKSAKVALNLTPDLNREGQDQISVVAGRDAVKSDKSAPSEVTPGSLGEPNPITTGLPGIGLSMGAFIKGLMESQSGTIKIATGDNSINFNLEQLKAVLSSTELSLNKSGEILLKNGTQSIQMKLDDLVFTLVALTLTIQGATKLTAKSIDLTAAEKVEIASAVTVIQKYKFFEDLITTLNTQWSTLFAAHTHGTPVGPTTAAGTPFPPITPTG